ncbi:hypothetical protein NLI96_g6459 [Meripilus lineatus]|uniref:DUF6533 domain-containing protein n=1 Tax=Meripilus lineatus TaxID=2056292 RepID=A0AAD5YCX9_9APHY|nr:hypothetical protein NLI96_g6459 [Physisporinus lineatus]
MDQPALPWDIRFYHEGQSANYAFMALPTLLVYEVFSTWDEEIEVIWKRRFSIPSLLYVSIRIGTLAYIVINVVISLYNPGNLTVYANIRQHISISLHYTHRCKYESIFSDVFLGVVLLAFAGTLYFGCHLIINAIAIILNYTLTGDGELSPLSSFAYTFTSILFTRFILNLRLVDSRNSQGLNESLHYSSINFATSMGAPLEHSPEDEGSYLTFPISQQQRQNPLSIGILDAQCTDFPSGIQEIS